VQKRQPQRHQRGLSLIEVALALSVMALIIGGMVAYGVRSSNQAKLRRDAQHFVAWAQAASAYVDANQAQFKLDAENALPGAPDGTKYQPAPQDLPDDARLNPLKKDKFISESVSAVIGANQTLRLRLQLTKFTNGAGKGDWQVQALLFTRQGTDFSDDDAGAMALMAGAMAGTIKQADPGKTIHGANGSWRSRAADWADDPASGHLVALIGGGGLTGGAGSFVNTGDWLARKLVAGRPELNRMETEIAFGQGAGTSATLGQAGPALTATLPAATADPSTSGTLKVENGNLKLAGNATLNDACAENGLLNSDGAGRLLVCQNRRWQTAYTSGTPYFAKVTTNDNVSAAEYGSTALSTKDMMVTAMARHSTGSSNSGCDVYITITDPSGRKQLLARQAVLMSQTGQGGNMCVATAYIPTGVYWQIGINRGANYDPLHPASGQGWHSPGSGAWTWYEHD